MAKDNGRRAGSKEKLLLCKKTAPGRQWLAIAEINVDNAPARQVTGALNGGSVGSPATLTCELGQIRKEAAAAGNVCAGMRLAEPPPNSCSFLANSVFLPNFIPLSSLDSFLWSQGIRHKMEKLIQGISRFH